MKTVEPILPKLCKAKTLAVIVGLSKRTIEKYQSLGIISSMRVGGSRLYDPELVVKELKEFAQG